MGSGVAWQPLLSGRAFRVPGGGVCSPLLTNGSFGLCPEGEAQPTECWGSCTLLGLLAWSGAKSGAGHLEPYGNRALPDPVPRLQSGT